MCRREQGRWRRNRRNRHRRWPQAPVRMSIRDRGHGRRRRRRRRRWRRRTTMRRQPRRRSRRWRRWWPAQTRLRRSHNGGVHSNRRRKRRCLPRIHLRHAIHGVRVPIRDPLDRNRIVLTRHLRQRPPTVMSRGTMTTASGGGRPAGRRGRRAGCS